MHLLKINSRNKISQPIEFVTDIPPYAVLSHTWGAEADEVIFADQQNGTGKNKAGHEKIQFCGARARDDGIQYFWVDTCCINKANLTELTEAIVSMFRWYRDAEKCYVYLSDVSAHSRDKNNSSIRPWESAFRRSRWFTRGWTLQELLAPKVVEFYSREGELLGDKDSLEQIIHEVTELPVKALRGDPFSHFSIDERMRWAENRVTKRKEDKAYCLLGIFNVFMPPIYGEEDHALIRLMDAIETSKKSLNQMTYAKGVMLDSASENLITYHPVTPMSNNMQEDQRDARSWSNFEGKPQVTMAQYHSNGDFRNSLQPSFAEFETRRDSVNLEMENKPYLQDFEGVPWTEGYEEIRLFMRDSTPEAYCSQASKVGDFCSWVNPSALFAESREELPLVAWLDEREFVDSDVTRVRPNCGPLTAAQLCQELRKPRFQTRRNPTLWMHTPSATPGSEQEEPDVPNADRRLIFITNLDRWSISALILTASSQQAIALRDALNKYLAFEAFFGVKINPTGFRTFQLAFHLPYYVWRSSPRHYDPRQYPDGHPLRQTRDVSFLSWKNAETPSFLYEAQISCVVDGIDNWRWVAHCFVDNYFDDFEERETVEYYDEMTQDCQGFFPDPLTRGNLDLDLTIWNPRQYFLQVFRFRLDKVQREWEQVVTKLQESVREYMHYHRDSLALSTRYTASDTFGAWSLTELFLKCILGRSSSEGVDNPARKVRKYRDWAVRIRTLSRELWQDLSKTLDAYEIFRLKHVVHFQNLPDSHPHLLAVQEIFDKLEMLKKTLQLLVERCNGLAQDILT